MFHLLGSFSFTVNIPSNERNLSLECFFWRLSISKCQLLWRTLHSKAKRTALFHHFPQISDAENISPRRSTASERKAITTSLYFASAKVDKWCVKLATEKMTKATRIWMAHRRRRWCIADIHITGSTTAHGVMIFVVANWSKQRHFHDKTRHVVCQRRRVSEWVSVSSPVMIIAYKPYQNKKNMSRRRRPSKPRRWRWKRKRDTRRYRRGEYKRRKKPKRIKIYEYADFVPVHCVLFRWGWGAY